MSYEVELDVSQVRWVVGPGPNSFFWKLVTFVGNIAETSDNHHQDIYPYTMMEVEMNVLSEDMCPDRVVVNPREGIEILWTGRRAASYRVADCLVNCSDKQKVGSSSGRGFAKCVSALWYGELDESGCIVTQDPPFRNRNILLPSQVWYSSSVVELP